MSENRMFWVYFDDGTTVRIWCKKEDADFEALSICAEYNHYYHERFVVVVVEEESNQIEIQ